MLHIGLNPQVGELATNKSLRVEDSVPRVRRGPVLCGVSDETLDLGGCDIGGCCAVTLVVGDDLDTIILPDTDATGEQEESALCFQSAHGRLQSTHE